MTRNSGMSRVNRLLGCSLVAILTTSVLTVGGSSAFAQDQPNRGSNQGQGSADDGNQARNDDRPGRGDRGNRGERGARGDRGNRGGPGGWWGERGGPGRDREGGGNRGGGPGRGLGMLGTPDGLFSPDFMTRDAPMVIEELKLDDTQRAIVAQLLQDYDDNFRTLVDTLRAETELLNEEYVPDPEIETSMQQVRDAMGDMRQEMRDARSQFERDSNPDAERPGRGRNNQGRGQQGRGNNDPNAPGQQAGQQDGEGGQGQDITREQMREQAEALRQEFRLKFDDLRDQMQRVREKRYASTEMQTLLDGRVALIRNFARDKQQLRDSTANGIQALLVENQIVLWDEVSRKLRRNRLMSRGQLSGESTDLTEILDEMNLGGLDENKELILLQKNYSMDLDEALKSRELFNYTDGLDLMEHLRDQDFDQGLVVLRKRLALQETTRDVNDQYIEAMSLVLPGIDGDDFRMRSLRRGYAGVFRPTRGERVLLSAMEIEDLDPEVLGAVAELMENHGAEIASFNEDILVILRSEESARELQRAEDRMNRSRGERRSRDQEQFDPVREAFEKRNQIDERYLATLESLLTAEQFEAIAGRRNRDRGRGQRGRGQGGEGGFSREDFVGQFDTNGDGQLDDEERQAARDAMRERFRGGGGRGGGNSRPGEL